MSGVAAKVIGNQLLAELETEVKRQANLNELSGLVSMVPGLPSAFNPIRDMLAGSLASKINSGLSDLKAITGSLGVPKGMCDPLTDKLSLFDVNQVQSLIIDQAKGIDPTLGGVLGGGGSGGSGNIYIDAEGILKGTAMEVVAGMPSGLATLIESVIGMSLTDLAGGLSPISTGLNIEKNLPTLGLDSLGGDIINLLTQAPNISGIGNLSSLLNPSSITSPLVAAPFNVLSGFGSQTAAELESQVSEIMSKVNSLSSTIKSFDIGALASLFKGIGISSKQRIPKTIKNYAYKEVITDYEYKPLL